jgi:DnaJ-class molecular chaperone
MMDGDIHELKKCVNCDGDGWVEIMDPHFYGAVIGGQLCPVCEGSGWVYDLEDEESDA